MTASETPMHKTSGQVSEQMPPESFIKRHAIAIGWTAFNLVYACSGPLGLRTAWFGFVVGGAIFESMAQRLPLPQKIKNSSWVKVTCAAGLAGVSFLTSYAATNNPYFTNNQVAAPRQAREAALKEILAREKTGKPVMKGGSVTGTVSYTEPRFFGWDLSHINNDRSTYFGIKPLMHSDEATHTLAVPDRQKRPEGFYFTVTDPTDPTFVRRYGPRPPQPPAGYKDFIPL